jgi:hypothetical protein
MVGLWVCEDDSVDVDEDDDDDNVWQQLWRQ